MAGRSLALARSRSSASPGQEKGSSRGAQAPPIRLGRTASLQPRARQLAMRNGRLARRRHQQQEGAPLPDQPGRVQVLPAQAVAVAAWAEVVEPAAPVEAIDRHSPGRCRASCAPIRSPPGSGSSLVCRVPAAVVGEHGDVEVGGRGSRRGQVTRRASSRVHRETTPYQPHRNNQSRFAHDSETVTSRPVREGAGSR